MCKIPKYYMYMRLVLFRGIFQYNNVLVQTVRREMRIEKASLQHTYQPLVHACKLQPIQACTRQYGETENSTASAVILQDASILV
jgi:hypothetical protein